MLSKQLLALKRLYDAQIAARAAALGFEPPLECWSALRTLSGGGNLSLADLARTLDVSHQLAAQRTGKLEALGLVQRRASVTDRRRRLLALTADGEAAAQVLQRLDKEAARLDAEIDAAARQPLGAALRAAERMLARKLDAAR